MIENDPIMIANQNDVKIFIKNGHVSLGLSDRLNIIIFS